MEGAKPAASGFNKRRASEVRDANFGLTKTLPLKVRRLNPVNTTAYVQILGTGMDTLDTSPSVLLFFDQQRFIFNVGEGLQRYCTEHKIKLSKIDHIFLSRVCSESTGGLPGMLLTLAGIGEEGRSVNLWGPSDLKYLVDAMRSFVPQAAMLHTRSFGSAPSFNDVQTLDPTESIDPIVLVDDEVVKISAIMLRPYVQENLQVLNEGPTEQNPLEMVKDSMDHLSTEPHRLNNGVESAVKSSDMSVIYLCELPAIKGKFDPAKAVALGLKAGPKYRQLQLGKSVKSDHKDIMVHPDDVMGPSIPGPILLIVDCPTESHLQEMLSIKCLNTYYADLDNQLETSKIVTCVIHLSPMSVTCNLIYQNWMKRFGSAQHIMAGHELKNVEVPILKSSARITTRLNYLCPQVFPVPGFCSSQDLNNSAPNSIAQSKAPPSKVCESVSAENLLKFMLRPYSLLGLDRCNIPSVVTRKQIVDELLLEVPEIVDAAKLVNQFWVGPQETQELEENFIPACLENIKRDDLEIVFLGTGSSQPSKYRNVSSIYVNLFSNGSLLLDCGEGTLGQLKRRYGVHGADDAVRSLRCIWISHIHADHHTGLVRILAQRRDLLKDVPHEPIIVVGPQQLKRFLNAYQRLEELDMQFLDCFHTSEACNLIDNSIQKRLQRVLDEVGLKALISVPVQHCQNAYGVVLEANERVNNVGKVIPGWKIVYSGDTVPCMELIKASHDATILIHEATFEDAMEEEAAGKRHSTTSQAIEVGLSAGAYRIILTHFSQRYPKIPVIDSTHMGQTCIAFDLMSVNIADLHVLPEIFPSVKLLFKNETVNDEPEDAEAQNVITS